MQYYKHKICEIDFGTTKKNTILFIIIFIRVIVCYIINNFAMYILNFRFVSFKDFLYKNMEHVTRL